MCRQGNDRIDFTPIAPWFQLGGGVRAVLFLCGVLAALYPSKPCLAEWTGPTFPNGSPIDSSEELLAPNPDKLHQLEDRIVTLATIRLHVQRTRTYQHWMNDEDCVSHAHASLSRAVDILTQPRPLYSDTEKDAFSAIDTMSKLNLEVQNFYDYCVKISDEESTCQECQTLRNKGCGSPWGEGYGVCRGVLDMCVSCNPHAVVSQELKDALDSLKNPLKPPRGDPPPPDDMKLDWKNDNNHFDSEHWKQLHDLTAPSMHDSFKFNAARRP